MKHITIAVPVRKWIGPESFSDEFRAFLKSLIKLAPGGYRFDLQVSVRDLCRARNEMVANVLNSAMDGILFVDDDMLPDAADALAILDRDMPVVGALYCKKENVAEYACNWRVGLNPVKKGAVRVLTLGCGFKYYHRDTFETTAKKIPEHFYPAEKGATHYGWFQQRVVAHKFWTEDYFMDLLCEYCDIPVMVDTNVRIKHRDISDGKIYPLGDWPPIPPLEITV